MTFGATLGAEYLEPGKCRFNLWAPNMDRAALRLRTGRILDLEMKNEDGVHSLEVEGVRPGTDYTFVFPEGPEIPDPASHFQPEGLAGPSRVVDHGAFPWQDRGWKSPPLRDFILYEIHTGTFSPEGTFHGIMKKIPHLKELGITAVEIMPVAQFPGSRNWGYDGVFPYAVQNTYGGPAGLKSLVDACHGAGLAVVLDVVYNHFGPEGNVLPHCGPIFTDRYRTAWGQAINFDGSGSDEVREFFLQNALYWFRHFHMDALRLDAVHAINDLGAKHLLQEMSERVGRLSTELGRPLYLIAESDLNDTKVVKPRSLGGWGLDAAWSDDFHHSLHSLLTGESDGYYADFGSMASLAKAFREPHVFDGIFSPHRGRRFGNSARNLSGEKFVVCAQNHDQVGNRLAGERLSALAPRQALKLAAASVLLSPYLPLLFMGEEFGETCPFLYFADHSDPELLEAVRQGRKAEFKSFDWNVEPPDPFYDTTFRQCLLDWDKPGQDGHRELFELYKFLIRLRKEHPALSTLDPSAVTVRFDEERKWLSWERAGGGRRLKCLMNFSSSPVSIEEDEDMGSWRPLLGVRFRADGESQSRGYSGYEEAEEPQGYGRQDRAGGPDQEAESVAVAAAIEPWGLVLMESGSGR